MPLRMISAPIPPEDVEALRLIARAEDRSVSSLIRRAIRDLLDSQAGNGSAARMAVRADAPVS